MEVFRYGKRNCSFKPYYNWNTFNTLRKVSTTRPQKGFKPYYNWNTFNTQHNNYDAVIKFKVLNLIITGIPSILHF